jgi:hypothetical protein
MIRTLMSGCRRSNMSVWHAHGRPRLLPTRTPSLQEVAVVAAGLFVAVMIGIAASGMLPLV